MVDVDFIRKNMEAKMAKLPPTSPNKKINKQKLLQKNRLMDKENLEQTIHILKSRREEAIEENDNKKYFHTVAVERNESGNYYNRERIHELQTKMDVLKRVIPESDFNCMNTFSEISNPNFWNDLDDYSDVDKSQYYRDVFNIDPKHVVKFLEYLKYYKKIRELKTCID